MPVFSRCESAQAEGPRCQPDEPAESAWMWPGRAIAMLRGWCGIDRSLRESSSRSPHIAWAVGSAGLLSAGLFLLMKRAKLFPRTARPSNQPAPPALSTYDSVTGLPMKRLFMTLANQALSRARKAGRQVAIVLVESDHFALAEDQEKASHNSLVYRVQAARLKSALRTTDTVARLGERSFAALIEEIADASEVGAVAAKMQATVSLPFVLEGREMFLTSRIGIGLSSPDTKDAAGLLDLAGRAVTQARTEGYVIYGLSADAATSSPHRVTGVPFQ